MQQQTEPIDDEQQGQSRVNKQDPETIMRLSLNKRWEKQKKYEEFIEQSRQMWDQFTGGSVASLNKNKRLKKKAEEALKKKEEDGEKERLKKEQARKLLSIKLRKQAEERRIKAA